jgi:hypothetical protein
MNAIDSNRFSWSQALNNFKPTELEAEAKDKNLDGDERVGKTAGQGLLHTD